MQCAVSFVHNTVGAATNRAHQPNIEDVMIAWGQSAVFRILCVSSKLTSDVTPSPAAWVQQAEWNHCASGEPLDYLQSSVCWCHPCVRNEVPTLSRSDFIATHLGDHCRICCLELYSYYKYKNKTIKCLNIAFFSDFSNEVLNRIISWGFCPKDFCVRRDICMRQKK